MKGYTETKTTRHEMKIVDAKSYIDNSTVEADS